MVDTVGARLVASPVPSPVLATTPIIDAVGPGTLLKESLHMLVKGVELLLQHSKCLSLHQTALHQTALPAATNDIVFCSIACGDPNHKSAEVAGLLFICAYPCPSALSVSLPACMPTCLVICLRLSAPPAPFCVSVSSIGPQQTIVMCAAIERVGTTVSAARSQREAAVAPGNPTSHP